MKTALVELIKALPANVKLIACVHDEIILECPNNLADEVSELLKGVMVR